jgi:hypothetical protein
MTNNLYPPARPQTVGEILDTAFRIFRATLLKCLLFATVSLLVGQLPNVYTLLRGRPVQRLFLVEPDPLWWLLAFLGSVLVVALTGAIVRRQYAIASGRPLDLGAELTAALRLVPGLIALWTLVLLATMAGLLLLVIPGMYIGIRLSCAVTTYLLTDRGVFASMRHSWYLTAGNFWRLSLIFSVYVVLIIVFYVLAAVIAAALAVPFALGDVALITAVTAAVVVILGSIVRPFYTALALAVFGDLSVRTEGTDLAARISSPV